MRRLGVSDRSTWSEGERMSTESRELDDVIDDGWEEVTKPYSVPAFVAALLEAYIDEDDGDECANGPGTDAERR